MRSHLPHQSPSKPKARGEEQIKTYSVLIKLLGVLNLIYISLLKLVPESAVLGRGYAWWDVRLLLLGLVGVVVLTRNTEIEAVWNVEAAVCHYWGRAGCWGEGTEGGG